MYKYVTLATFMGLLSGCGGGSSSSSTSTQPTTPPVAESTTLTLGVSDAPVTNIAAVWVAFDKITLRASGGQDTVVDINSEDGSKSVRLVNLLQYTGDDIHQLFANQQLEAGTYTWIRADVVNGDSSDYENTSHVIYKDGTYAPLIVNRKGNDGIGEIQLDGFDLVTGTNQFVMEFDLKKSLVDPKNNADIVLKPRGVRLENLAQKAKLEGSIATQLMADCEVANASLANIDNGFEHAIYLYPASIEAPADIYYENDEPSATGPIATALVSLNEDGTGHYEIAFLAQGNYKVGYTCLGHIDNIETQDANFTLYRTSSADVTSNTQVNFTE
ncbi:DUF4382 domain-containing protein [Pseudoalteromonas xiamenensis]